MGRRGIKPDQEKRLEAVRLLLSGLSYTEIGKCFGVSRQRANQLTRPTADIIEALKMRAEQRCEHCKIPIRYGHVHHKLPEDGTPEQANSIESLEYLCTSCHVIAHSGEPKEFHPCVLKWWLDVRDNIRNKERITQERATIQLDESMREFCRKFASSGGLARAKKYSKKQLSEWGKMGGRPRAKGSKRLALAQRSA